MEFKFFNTKEFLLYRAASKFDNKTKYIFANNNSIISECIENDVINVMTNIEHLKFGERKALFGNLVDLAEFYKAKKINMNNHLLKDFGFLPVVKYDQIIDLKTFNIDELKKGTRSILKKEHDFKFWKITGFDNDTYIKQSIESFRLCYFSIAGKETMPDKAFDIIADWIMEGKGMLLKCKDNNDKYGTVGYIYVHVHHPSSQAYYFMSCIYDQYKKDNAGYHMQLDIINWLKKWNVKYYIMGEQVYNNLHSNPTEKDYNISLFKRAFGGETIARIAGELYIDRQLMKQDYSERIDQYHRFRDCGRHSSEART